MTLIFCKSPTITGWLIRLLTFSEWSHVGIEVNGMVYESTGKQGVTRTLLTRFVKKYTDHIVINVELTKPDAAEMFLIRQLGKKYDYLALIAFPFRADWQDERRWFCSELAAKALIVGGRKLRLPEGRVTPRDLFIAS